MRRLSLTYYGHVFDASGYGQAARAYIHALHRAGISLSVVDLMNGGRQVRDELVESLVNRSITPNFHLFHGVPPQWARLALRVPNAIGMTVWETDTPPQQWRSVLSHVVDLWLPCEFNVEAFRRELHVPVFKLPHPVVARHPRGERPCVERFLDAEPSDFVFYSIFDWQERKGPHDLLRAYMRAFREAHGTTLVLKVNSRASHAASLAIADARRETGSSARVVVAAQRWSDAQIEALHERGDCYVSLHRGEGWGYPLFDAASRGKPVIATGFSGPLDYLSEEGARLVPYSMTAVRQPYVYYGPQMQWALPDVEAASRLLREVYENPDRARSEAAALGDSIQRAFSLERIGEMARERLTALSEAHDELALRRVTVGIQAPTASPPVPVPAEWYDANYFEHGITSNWTGGYTWDRFSGLFRETAGWIADLFPDATSFLDVGCAKGFLVRCLRDRGRECWGLDCSHWAIARADPGVRPFLVCAAAEALAFHRTVDVVVALDLCSHLTEAQAEAFLTGARSSTCTAIVAAIASFEDDIDAARYRLQPDHRDRSHVTMRTRSWWHELFLRCGWRQDPLHRLGAEHCQAHPLVQRMRWKVYAYAPK